MQDIFPNESDKWLFVEGVMRNCAETLGFGYVRVPIMEFTDLFCRSVGDLSDIVQKEMYTFEDKGGRSVTLRPEFTAGVLRAFLNISKDTVLPAKFMCFGPCFRYEKPQSGRYREFFQFDAEIFGGNSVAADAELIFLAKSIFKELGIFDLDLQINAVGCPECRAGYRDILFSYFEANADNFCDICSERLVKNPLRIFDCKNKICKKICEDAPHTIEHVCPNCKKDFEQFKLYLNVADVKYSVNSRMVRGLDYYTKLVFEFVTRVQGSDLTVCGGGRYDGLSEKFGAPNFSATGFGIGVERVISVMESLNFKFPIFNKRDLFVVSVDDFSTEAVKLVIKLRAGGISADFDLVGRNVKSQMRFADKMGYNFTIVLGPEEILNNKVEARRMSDGAIFTLNLDENSVDSFYEILNHGGL
jgi:histidyl-tRNA synthetase